MIAASFVGPPEPEAFQQSLLDLIASGDVDGAFVLASRLHAHYGSIPRDVAFEQQTWSDSFYVQGIKHALQLVLDARDHDRFKPVERPVSSPNPAASPSTSADAPPHERDGAKASHLNTQAPSRSGRAQGAF